MEWSVKSVMVLIVTYTLLMMVFILMSRKQKQLSDKFLILYAISEILGLSKYFAGFISNTIFQEFPQFYYLTIPICYTYIPLFYLYFLSNYNQGFVFRKKHLFHFSLFVVYQLYYTIRYLSKPVSEVQELIITRPTYIEIEWMFHEIILNIQFIIYSILLINASKKIYSNKQTIKNKPFLQVVLISYLVGIVVSITFTALALLKIKTPFDMGFWGIIYFYIFFILLFFITIRKIERDKFKHYYSQNQIDEAKAIELEKYIYSTIEKQKLYLDPQITLADCALKLNLEVKEFSCILNHYLQENFNGFINRFRIECAKEMLIEHPDLSVQEVMYSSGFNSKAVFYAVFKKQVNMSPGDFRKEKRAHRLQNL